MKPVTYYCKLCKGHGIKLRGDHLTKIHNANLRGNPANTSKNIFEGIFLESKN